MHEFYGVRAEITKRLIDNGFDAVGVEGDWPDAYRVNRFVRGGDDDDPLAGFRRFPAWTTALQPLERTSEWDAGEPPETYPFAV
jgi:erythromycin esterase-like protein